MRLDARARGAELGAIAWKEVADLRAALAENAASLRAISSELASKENEDGSLARTPELLTFKKKFGLKLISIA